MAIESVKPIQFVPPEVAEFATLAKAPTPILDTIEVEHKVEAGFFSRVISWAKRMFGIEPTSALEKEEASAHAPPEFDRQTAQLTEFAKIERQHLDEAQEEFTESELVKRTMELLRAHIGLSQWESLDNLKQIEILQKVGKQLKKEFDEALEKKLTTGSWARTLNKIGVGTSTALIALTLAVAVASFFTAGGAGAAAVATQSALSSISSATAVIGGGTAVASGILDYKDRVNKYKLEGLQQKMAGGHKKAKFLHEMSEDQFRKVTQLYATLSKSLDSELSTIQEVFHDN